MPPTLKDLTAVRGDTLSRTMTAYTTTGAVMVLTGSTLWFTVKLASDSLADDTSAITKCYWISGGASSGISVTAPATGVFVIDAPNADTINLDPSQSYVYDVQVKDSNGRYYTLAEGNVIVAGDVTRRITTP